MTAKPATTAGARGGVGRKPSRWWGARRGGPAVIGGWLATRVLSLGLLAGLERFVVGDVFYYWRKLEAIGGAGLARTLVEYPTPVVWLLAVPYGLGGGTRIGYLVAFVAAMLALDAAFTYALWRHAGRRHGIAVDFWLIFVLLIGPLTYLRFDILPAVLAGGAILTLSRRPWWAGALTGVGAAIKLWPALLIGVLLGPRQGRRATGGGFVLTGVGLAGISLLAGGWSRLFSPLTWQSDRGLQIESIWATPLMVARAIDPSGWVVDISRYQAYEIFGAGVGAWLTVSTAATGLGLGLVGLLWLRALRGSDSSTPSLVATGLAVLATVAVMTITNKTLSPQYLLWLGGPMAAVLLLRRDPAEETQTRGLAPALLGLALLTQLVYPALYDGLLGRQGAGMIAVSTAVTAARNLGLLAFTLIAYWRAWTALGPSRTLHRR